MELNKALELSPNDKNALLARSKCYLLLGEPQKALSDAEAALNEKMNDSNNARAIFYKAESLYHLGDFELSLVFYYRGIRIRPEFDQFRLGVQKAKEAIRNILDHCAPIEIDSQMERRRFKKLKFYNPLTKTAEIDEKIQQANGEKIIQHQNNSSTELFEKFKNSSAINRESSNLLGQLNVDKKYLQELIKRPEHPTNGPLLSFGHTAVRGPLKVANDRPSISILRPSMGHPRAGFRTLYGRVGVPQGTILGPLLFILYSDDIFNVIPSNNIVSYADDTAILCSGNRWDDTNLLLTEWLHKIDCWLKGNQLSLNIDKTYYITFGSYIDSVPYKYKLFINNKEINRIDSCKYLGIIFDKNMKWNIHTNELAKKIKFFLYLYYKLKHCIEPIVLKTIYYGLFDSLINYGIIAWGGAYENSVKYLVNVQNELIDRIFINNQLTAPLKLKENFGASALTNYFELCKNQYV
ncbi:uncharacterized protein LOC141536477 isoform X3 [Cotesia typhae]|uniref:uncharacterized protein LOC141536477 isoform X3 n=1 Tax=Cotesia typhae TaxID=2053667 RepID=UPI003D691F63